MLAYQITIKIENLYIWERKTDRGDPKFPVGSWP